MESLSQQLQAKISATPVLVYSKSTCGFCEEAKEILSSKGVSFEAIELNKISSGGSIQ